MSVRVDEQVDDVDDLRHLPLEGPPVVTVERPTYAQVKAELDELREQHELDVMSFFEASAARDAARGRVARLEAVMLVMKNGLLRASADIPTLIALIDEALTPS